MAATPIEKRVETIHTVELLEQTMGKHEEALIRITDRLVAMERRLSRLEARPELPPGPRAKRPHA